MKKNLVRKILPISYSTWTAPAGVEEVIVTVLDKFSDLGIVGKDTSAYALRKTGAAYAWGLGTSGQLGDATILSKSTPVPVSGGQSFVQLAAGQGHAVALRADGVAYAWGIGTSGQIGDNTITNKSAPTLVVGSHSFIQISAGSGNTGALKSNGSAWTWGVNITTGALGDGTTTNRSSPVPVIGGHSFISINAGGSMIALKSNGQLWSWGFNNNGQLGDNTVVNKSSPVQIVTGFTFEAGVQYANRRVFTVTPGTTYEINGFLTNIGSQVMLSLAQNNSYIVLEYYG